MMMINLSSGLGRRARRRCRYVLYCLLLFILLLVTVGLLYKIWGEHALAHHPKGGSYRRSSTSKSKSSSSSSKAANNNSRADVGCAIPELDPYHKSILHLLKNKSEVLESCEGKKYPLLFESGREESAIFPVKKEEDFRREGYDSCCYRTVERPRNVENLEAKTPEPIKVSPTCFPLALKSKTEIPKGHEFIAIYCKGDGIYGRLKGEKMVDAHAFVHLKPRGDLSSSSPSKEEGGGKEKLNVVIFGLDAVSRMSFLRTMPMTYAFLMEELGAVEMTGYNKIGSNTHPNLVPMLTSMTENELRLRFAQAKNFDDGPFFIWKQYSKKGYSTSLSEDAPTLALFSSFGRPGFNKPPVDYYPRPIISWTEDHIFHRQSLASASCDGPRSTLQFLLNYMEKYVHVLSQAKKNFFQLSWSTHFTHNDINIPHLADVPLHKSLTWLKASGHLNKTVFILMSDHGLRMTQFRNTIQGHLEDLLPFMFILLPDSFKEKYVRAYRNLVGSRDKLLTTFDMYETLKDILHLERIHPTSLAKREADLKRLGKRLPRGISRFLPIPSFRTCEMAGILTEFCSCTLLESVDVSNRVIKDIAKIAVAHINSLLTPEECAPLQLKKVMIAQYTGSGEEMGVEIMSYLINFETKPGGAQFEALISREQGILRKLLLDPLFGASWKVQGEVDRTNWYGNQSHCVTGKLRPYCYCKDLLIK